MNKYQNGKIYKIVDIGYSKCYIGSTCEELSQRMARHRAIYKQFAKGKKTSYLSAFDLFDEFGLDNCKVELLEAVAVNSRDELRQHEGKHIQINDCINKRIAGRTDEQYYQDNKDIINERHQQHYHLHKEAISQKHREYYEGNRTKVLNNQAQRVLCECGSEHRKGDKAKHVRTKKHLEYVANCTKSEEQK